ncbi:replication/maintenance protein RepL [Staphylococcus aureus]|nr:replication/maintenance protein RepL [Staphylococcus aureus]
MKERYGTVYKGSQRLIDEAQGDENKLYDLFIQKLAERHTRPAIVEY